MSTSKIVSLALTGIPIIDKQHRELFDKMIMLIDAVSSGQQKEQINEIITFLEKYVAVHFSTEEDYMLLYDYPRYVGHMRAHALFKDKVLKMKETLEKEGPSKELADSIQKDILNWYVNHIQKMDLLYAPFLKSKMNM